MALGAENGGSGDVSSLRFEVMRLKQLLELKEAEIKAVTEKLEAKVSELGEAGSGEIRDTRVEEELRHELEGTKKLLEEAEATAQKLREELKARSSSNSSEDVDTSELTREMLRAQDENRHLRQCVLDLNREKAEAVTRARSLDSKMMHAAAEAELAKLGLAPGGSLPGGGWSTTSVALVSLGAALCSALVVSHLKKPSS